MITQAAGRATARHPPATTTAGRPARGCAIHRVAPRIGTVKSRTYDAVKAMRLACKTLGVAE